MVSTERPAAADGAAPGFRYRFADVDFDELEGELRVAGRKVTVEPRPLRLLIELLRHTNEVVSKEELLDTVWEGRPTVDHVLANAVSKLRMALGETGAARVLTVPRVGYRLLGPVQRLAAHAAELVLQPGQAVPGREGYVLERALGQGSHGDVWLARHAKLGQAKVFKFASDGARLSALKREYTLYRLLKQELGARADFASVADANFIAAPYFLECEWGGVSVQQWAAAGGEGASRLAALNTGERVALFLQIARAVAAAHSVGVLHKDLKPSNVLVEADGAGWQLRLTDFGSGRLLDPARLDALKLTGLGLTQTEGATSDSRSGTLMYLAPELLAGHAATVQSDVYSLGVMLYQLLAGDLDKPLVTGWQRDIEDVLLRADITAATEGEPQARLGSAAELADRLARLPLRREEAALNSTAQQRLAAAGARERRQQERRPWVLAAFASLSLGLAASLLFAWHAQGSLTDAQRSAQRANLLNDFMLQGFVSGLVVERIDEKANVSMIDTLQRASDRASQRFKDFPTTEAELRLNLAQSYYRLSRFALALRELQRAVVVLEPVAVDAASQSLLRRVRLHLADVLIDLDRQKEARALLGSAAAGLAAEPTDPADPLSRMFVQVRMKLAYHAQDYANALQPAKRLVELTEALPPDAITERFGAHNLLGDVQYFLGQADAAEATFEKIRKPPFDINTVGPVQLARATVQLCRARLARGHSEGVEALLIEARAGLLQRNGSQEVFVPIASAELGGYYESQNRFREAEAAYRDALAGFTVAVGEGNASTRITRLNLSIMELNNGHAQAALLGLETSRPWFASQPGGEKSPVVQAIDFERARAMTVLARPQEALQTLAGLSAARLAQAAPARDWPWRLQAERGRALLRAGQRAEGQALLREAVARMPEAGTAGWVLASYTRELQAAAPVARP